ncbi:Cysteine-rich secretory protein 2 [Armadillidium vulgare]|nr:Cysteine-rich secretory protein 2 [Armadillidium vulgare]
MEKTISSSLDITLNWFGLQLIRGNHLSSLSTPYKKGAPCSSCEGHCKARKLCKNSCSYGDIWINCKELDFAFHNWLCNSKKTKQGLQRFRHCKATCLCKNKITFPYD